MKSPNVFFGLAVLLPLLSDGEESAVNNSIYVNQKGNLKMNLEKPGWKLTFHDEFDRPQLNDIYWYPAYRSGRVEYLNRCGLEQRWVDHNAHYVIEDGILKLRISEKLPYRPDRSHRCVSCITTSDHRIGATP